MLDGVRRTHERNEDHRREWHLRGSTGARTHKHRTLRLKLYMRHVSFHDTSAELKRFLRNRVVGHSIHVVLLIELISQCTLGS